MTMPFCDNEKCQFHAVQVSLTCRSIERPGAKVERFLYQTIDNKPLNFCECCHAAIQQVMPSDVEMIQQTVERLQEKARVWQPEEKKLILAR